MLTASFRFYLTIDTLAVQLYTSLSPRRVRDFHPLERAHGAQTKNCHLLLLDEPTAALDAISENKMYEIYSTLLKNKTALFISHRLASTRFCDTILFLENGKIKECGTHDELIALGGSYAHMFEVQSQYYQETEEDI